MDTASPSTKMEEHEKNEVAPSSNEKITFSSKEMEETKGREMVSFSSFFVEEKAQDLSRPPPSSSRRRRRKWLRP